MVEQVVDTEDAFKRAVDLLRKGNGPVAVDAERASGFRYSQRAYLIQMYRRDSGTFLFDPMGIADFGPLQAALGNTEWILHAASQDLPCLREVNLDPAEIFDTELAARLLGMPRVGLAAVVEELLGVLLAKEHSAADWSTRPLPEAWLTYAALDVELLVDLRDKLVDLLCQQGKTEIARQEFEAELHREPKKPAAEPWRRLSGVHALRNPRNLAVARELWEARNRMAVERDVSPGRLIPDVSIVAAAKALPSSRQTLAGMKDFHGRLSRSELDVWWSAIHAGMTTTDLPASRVPSEGPPPPRVWSVRDPAADARLRHAKEALTGVAEKLSMPVENLLTPDHLRRLAWRPPVDSSGSGIANALRQLGSRAWQVEATAHIIAEAFVSAEQELVEAIPDVS